LDSTVDYRAVVEAVRALVGSESHALIETLAERIAAMVAQMSGVFACTVVVRKPEAADRLGAAGVSAEATVRGDHEEHG
ncbi:MAG: dihydroneopterin aldolase, partial [Actinomycetota bacterium]|nr:dihydroneopterin aldolase [Actinomycetota bacterium]